MNKKVKSYIRDGAVTAAVLMVVFALGVIIQVFLGAQELVPLFFILAVFVVSMLTNGYIFGIIATFLSVLAVNFAFSFPYFAFNFTLPENIISALILLFVAAATSTLTTKIKEQEKIRLRAEREKMRADLLRAISHDLRTPLTGIYGSTSTIIENYDALDDRQKQDILAGIQNDSQWLIRMVENLLSITRLDGNSVNLHKSSVVLDELIDSVLGKFRNRYPRQEVELDLPDEFAAVSADPLLIEQVLQNLLENAVQHATGMTRLSLKVSLRNGLAVFEVMDNGCGCDKERLKNIFTGYYMSEGRIQDNQKRCMGIGLSVCAAIVRAHGGEISAENLPEGGMSFRFTLETENCDEQQVQDTDY